MSEYRRSIDTLRRGANLVELRLLKKGQPPAAGVFDVTLAENYTRLIDHVQLAEAEGYNVYMTANAIRPDYKVTNSVMQGAAAVKDTDITRRRWLMFDFDPERGEGHIGHRFRA